MIFNYAFTTAGILMVDLFFFMHMRYPRWGFYYTMQSRGKDRCPYFVYYIYKCYMSIVSKFSRGAFLRKNVFTPPFRPLGVSFLFEQALRSCCSIGIIHSWLHLMISAVSSRCPTDLRLFSFRIALEIWCGVTLLLRPVICFPLSSLIFA